MLGDRKTVVLRGGAPWGFRLSGGGQTSVYIAKVRSRSKAALGGLAAGDSLVSVNGISSLQQSLREINDIIDTVRDQLILEVHSSAHSRGVRLDSSSSIDTRENSPVRSIHRITPQPKPMDHPQYTSARTTPTYPLFPMPNTSVSNTSDQYHHHQANSVQHEPRYMDSYGRSINNPLSSLLRTATITANSPPTPVATARVQQFSPRPIASNSTYDTPRNYNGSMTSGYLSDTNDFRRSSISVRPSSHNINTNQRLVINQQPSTAYQVKVSTNHNEANYYSDSECVTAGPRYYKISRQVNSSRRPSNVVLPIRSMTSKAYEPYLPLEPSPPVPTPIDVYRPQPAVIPRFNAPPKLSMPSADYGQHSRHTVEHEIGAELMKSPIADKKRYASSSFFKTPYNTYPTIDDQKSMARKIASILEGGDPTQKGATKFEKQRQRAEKYITENDSIILNTNNYRPLRPLQTNESSYSPAATSLYTNRSSDVPNCIKHSLNEAQYINPLRYVGAPEEFKQIHMQEHVTHTNVPPQAAMNLVADLHSSQGKGAALFQKRKARSDKWIIDENNVKKQQYPPINTYPTPTNKPWGQHAPASWSDNEGPSLSPIRPAIVPEPLIPSVPVQAAPRFGDFNAKPKGFGNWTAENSRSPSPRAPPIDNRKPLNLNIEPSIREGIAESHTRSASQPWSPPYNAAPTATTTNHYFNYPTDSHLGQWNSHPSSIPSIGHDGVDHLRQRWMQDRTSTMNQFNSYSSHFTDL